MDLWPLWFLIAASVSTNITLIGSIKIEPLNEAILGKGFHFEKEVTFNTTSPASPSWLCVYQKFPKELFLDKFQLPRFYSKMYLESKGLDQYIQYKEIWVSSIVSPDLEAPSCMATSFEAILYFEILEPFLKKE